MSRLEQINKLREQAAETETDMTEARVGGKSRLLPEGYSLAHIVGLIQYGNQPQSYMGTPKDPAPELTLQFALYDEGYCNEDGTPYVVEPYPFAESQFEKSRAFKMFKLLNWDGTGKSWIDLITKPIMVQIEHYKGGKDKKETKSRVKWDGFLPPIDIRSKKPYDVPALDEDLLVCFLWEYPTLDNWNALRDFHKEKCLDALNFAGSELEAMLLANGLPTTYEKKAKQEESEPAEADAPQQAATNVTSPSQMAMPSPE